MATITQQCACVCGASSIQIHGVALGRFFCHCTICQSVYGQPRADVTVFPARAATTAAGHRLTFRYYRSPPVLARGTCAACGSPLLALTPGPAAFSLAFVPARAFERPEVLPPATHHVFYHRRIANVTDPLPKISGYWRGEAAIAGIVIRGMFGA